MEMGYRAYPMFDMIKNQDCFCKAEDRKGECQHVLRRQRQTLKARHRIIRKVANCASKELWQLILSLIRGRQQAELIQFAFNEREWIMAGELFCCWAISLRC